MEAGTSGTGEHGGGAPRTGCWGDATFRPVADAALLVAVALLAYGCGDRRDGGVSGPSEAADVLAITDGDGQRGPAGTLLPTALEVTVRSRSGEPVTGAEVHFTASAGRVVPSRGGTDSLGRRSVRLTLPDRPGPVTVTASSDGVSDVRFRVEAVAAPPNPYEFPLGVSDRYLVDATGRSVILNGDAGWGIAVQLDSSEVRTYLDTRVEQGVNGILFRAIDHLFSDDPPANTFGDAPFSDTLPGGEEDVTSLDPAYWDYVEWIVSEARDRGMVCLVAPAYVGHELGEQGWAAAMEANGVSRLEAYGDSLGRRFSSYGNVIWVMGGDSEPTAGGRDVTAEVNAVARGVERFMPGALFTAHSGRGLSALDSYDQPWLDVNSTYSDTLDGPSHLERDYQRTDGFGEPAMPSIWIEGYYENEHSMSAVELRSQMYWSLLGGAAGHIYGADPVWSFDAPPASDFGDSSAPPYDTWRHALTTDVAWDLLHVRRLIDTRPFPLLVPDFEREVVTSGREEGSGYAAAARASDGSLILAYLPDRREVTVELGGITTDTVVDVSWVSPRTGDTTRVGMFPTDGAESFTPPSDTVWLLVVEDAPHQ